MIVETHSKYGNLLVLFLSLILVGNILLLDFFNEINDKTILVNNLISYIACRIYKGPCDRLRDTGTPSGRKRKILELSSYDT